MNKPVMTAAEASADERRLWMRRVRELRSALLSGSTLTAIEILDLLIAYGDGRTKRNAVKPGGQGRSKKKK